MATAIAATHMTTEEVQEALHKLGWPIEADGVFGAKTFEAVMDFQRGYAFSKLRMDGHAGEQTQEALRHAVETGGRTSPHFRIVEFKSKGNGWIKLFRKVHDTYEAQQPFDNMTVYGMAAAYTFVRALQLAGRNPTRQSIVAALNSGAANSCACCAELLSRRITGFPAVSRIAPGSNL